MTRLRFPLSAALVADQLSDYERNHYSDDRHPGSCVACDAAAALRRELDGLQAIEAEEVPPPIDVEAVRAACEAALGRDPHSSYEAPTAAMVFEPRLVELFRWECPSCRPEVGWPNTPVARLGAGHDLWVSIQCGHCGADTAWNLDGTEREA